MRDSGGKAVIRQRYEVVVGGIPLQYLQLLYLPLYLPPHYLPTLHLPPLRVETTMNEVAMRVSPAEYLGLKLRAHELLGGVPLHDVSVVDLPGGGPGRSLADLRRLDRAARPSRLAGTLFGLRRWLGRVFGWDRTRMRAEDSLVACLSQRDRQESEIAPGTFDGPFLVIYQFPTEALRETRNATVHGWISMALAPTAAGYRLYWAVYVRPVSWITRPYLLLIEPFRRVLYPAMLRRIRRAWIASYGPRDL